METVLPSEPAGFGSGAPVLLPMAPASARLAREHVRRVTGPPEDPRVALVVTELVNNAVLHARSRPRLAVTIDGGSLVVGVFDDSPGSPVLTPLSDAPTTSGRGLALVDALADRWGVRVEPDGSGKTVWAVISLLNQ